MIHWPGICRLLGLFTVGLSLAMIFPLLLAVAEEDAGRDPLVLSFLISLLVGAILALLSRPRRHEINRREGIFFVVLAWSAAAALGALPFYFSGVFSSYTDAYFESISGFTTTGATVLSVIETVPRSLLLWRSLTHWLGGMGIIVLGIAVLPLLGASGVELYRSEFSGARSEKLKPRVAETAMALWKIYVGMTLSQYVLLRLAGMSVFDALNHSFSTMATGGFSTRNTSVEAFASPAVEYIIILFMILAGINFTLHYRLFVERKGKAFGRDIELRFFLLVILLATAAVGWARIDDSASFHDAFREALFQVVSIVTTTGFSSVNFETWGPFEALVLLTLMFLGACTGSTAGGMKMARIVLLFRVVAREFRRMSERRGVFAVRVGGKPVSEQALSSLLNLVYLAFLVNFSGCLILTALGVDVLTSIAAVAASMFNIGPGLGDVGPAENYGHLPTVAKWVLSFCMLAGRLEFYTVLVIFAPSFWRK